MIPVDLKFRHFVGRYWVDRVVICYFKDDNDVLARWRVAEKARSVATAAGGFIFWILEDVFDVLNSQTVLGYVLDVTIGIVVIIPNNLKVTHRRAPPRFGSLSQYNAIGQ